MINNSLTFRGKYSWEVRDVETNQLVRSGSHENLIVNVGKNAVAADLGGGADFTIDTIKIGTSDTAFAVTDTDLNAELDSTTATVSVTDNEISASALFLFGSDYNIEEAGLFAGATALSLTNGISEDVSSTQSLSIIWTITVS